MTPKCNFFVPARRCISLALAFVSISAIANPQGGSVVSGDITITSGPGSLTINQASKRAIINWADFSIAEGEITRFVQPDALSAVLNRVVSGNPSSLLGTLQANGRVYLLNQNGVLVGKDARVDTAGFMASTLDISDDEFLAGTDMHLSGDSEAAVTNLGNISVSGGDIFLIARNVTNEGELNAPGGAIGLAAGSEILVTTGGSERVFVQAATSGASVANAGNISAATAELKAAGGNAFALAVNNSGNVRATGTEVKDGRIWLVADGGTTENSGGLEAQDADGTGGFIETSGNDVSSSGSVSTGVGGTWFIDPTDVTVDATYVTTNSVDTTLSGGSNVDIAATNNITLSTIVTSTGTGNFSLTAGNDILVTGGGVSLQGGSVTLTSDSDASGAGVISIDGTSSFSTGGGDIILGGGSNALTGYAAAGSDGTGISLASGSSLSSGGGNITIRGKGYGDDGSMGYVGVSALGSIDSGTGSVSIVGTNATNGPGVYLPAGASVTSALSGGTAINIQATAKGSSSSNAPGMEFGADVSATGSGGNISITGVGAAGSSPNGNQGVNFFAGSVLANGNVTIDSTANLSGLNAEGLYIANTIASTGGGTVSITGNSNKSANASIVFGAGASVGSATTSLVSLTAKIGGVTVQSGSAITGTALQLTSPSTSTGAFDFSAATSNVGTLAADVYGAFSFVNAAPLAIGTVNGTVGVASHAYDTTVQTTSGDITLDQAIGVGGAAKITVASAGNFINNVGSAALIIGSTGKWNVWSTDPASDTRGSLAYDFKQYNATYGVTAVQGTGNGFLYTTAPSLTPTLTGSATKVYDTGTTIGTSSFTYGVTGGIDGDTVSLAGPTAVSYADPNVGTGKEIDATGFSISSTVDGSKPVYGYSLVSASVAANIGTITAAPLTAIGIIADNKVYDTTTDATLTTTAVALDNVLGSDDVTLTGTPVATFDTAGVGSAIAVTVTGYSITGAQAGNYSFSQPTGLTADITPATLSVTLVGNTTKMYDATTAATLAGANYSMTGVLGLDVVTLNNPVSGTFTTKDVGTSKPITVSGLAISGASAGNYQLASATVSGNIGTITQAPLTVAGLIANNKVYDTTTSAPLDTTSAALDNVLGSDTVSLDGTPIGTFANSNVAAGKPVTVTGYSISGTDAGNYNFSQPSGLTADITPATLSVTLVGNTTKMYDATTAATLAGANYSMTGVLGLDTVTLNNPASGTFDTKDVGTVKKVTATGLAISGASAANYQLASTTATGNIGTITQAPLTVVGLVANNKVYDTTTSAPLDTTSAALDNVLGSDTVSLDGPPTGTFANANVATGKGVTVTGYSISGTDAGNYSFSQPAGLTADITPATLSVTLVGNTTKMYDATTAASLASANYNMTGVLGLDTVTLNNPASGTFDTKDVGTAKKVTATGLAISGASAGNYQLASTTATGNIGTITQAPLTVVGLVANNKVYDTTTSAPLDTTSAALDNVLLSDAVILVGPPVGTFADINVGTGKAVTVTNYSISGTDAGNYNFSQPSGLTADITPATLSVTLVGNTTKVYDATTAATLAGANYSMTGVLGLDTVTLNNPASGTFDTKNVGTAKTVTATGLAISGASAGNYQLASTTATGNIGTITQAPLTVVGLVANNKVYDTTTSAPLDTTSAALDNVLLSDAVTLVGPPVGSFADINVGTGKAVTVTNYSIGGTDAGNYNFSQPTGLTADITPATLSVTLVGNTTKMYDATTAATLAGANYNMTGVLGLDTVTLNNPASGTFDTKNVGTAKTVTATGLAISGASAGNYQLASTTATGNIGTITQAPLTVVGLVANNKVYDTTTSAPLDATSAALDNVLGSDTVSLDGPPTGTFANANVATGKGVTVTGYSISGTDAGNYNFSQPTGLTADITPATLSVTLVGNTTKMYDATTAASLASANYNMTGVLGLDTVTLNNPASGTFDTKDVGTAKKVTATGLAISGASAGNYQLASTTATGNIGTITRAPLTVVGLVANNKVYDTTTSAPLDTTSAALDNVLLSDAVTLVGPPVGSFADINVGTGKAVTVTNYSISGTDAGNYNFSQPSGLTADITPATISVALTGELTKIYDTTTSITVPSANVVVSGVLGSDDVNVTGTSAGAFDTPDAGTGKIVTVSGMALSGADIGNYMLASSNVSANVGSVTPAALSVTAADATRTYGDANPAFSATISGFVGGETASVLSGNLSLTTSATPLSDIGSYDIVPAGLTSNNYDITFSNAMLTVTPAALIITANDASRLYGLPNPVFTASFDGFRNNDDSSVVDGLVFSTPADDATPPGVYPISPLGASTTNYEITYVDGSLTIDTPVSVAEQSLPIANVGGTPPVGSSLALVVLGGRPVLMPIGNSNTSDSPVDAQSSAAMLDSISMSTFGRDQGATPSVALPGRSLTLPGFTVVTGGTDVSAGGSTGSGVGADTSSDDVPVMRISSIDHGSFQVIYQEMVDQEKDLEAGNTVVSSSYAEFGSHDAPTIMLLKRAPGSEAASKKEKEDDRGN